MAGSSGLGDILNKTLGDMGLFPTARKYQVFSLWGKIVGDIAKYARPRRIQGDILFVATASSVWSQELYFMRESIVRKVNAALGSQDIKEVRFSEHMWGSADERNSVRADMPDALPAGAPGAERLADLGGEIDDPDLLCAFKRTAATMARRKQYFLAKGYKLCRDCGCVYPKEKAECPACKTKRESTLYARAIAILDQRPHIGSEELSRLAGLPDPWLCERARREVESRLLTFIRYRLAAAARDAESDSPSRRRRSPEAEASRAEVAAVVRKLASLRSLIPFESMSDEDLDKAVGRRYASLARKG